MSVDVDGTVYVSDYNRNAVFAVAPTGAVARVVGLDNFDSLPASGGGGPAAEARTYGVSGVAAFNGSLTIGHAPFELRRVVNQRDQLDADVAIIDRSARRERIRLRGTRAHTAAGEPLLQNFPGSQDSVRTAKPRS